MLEIDQARFFENILIGPKWAKLGHFWAQSRYISNLHENDTINFVSFLHGIRQL